jgi:hypothetical protein
MKPMALAATAALVAVARIAAAQTTGSGGGPAVDGIVRAAAEAHAMLANMQQNARIARDALQLARAHKRRDEIRCADESLSRADVALRRAREDASDLSVAMASHDATAASAALERVRVRYSASHEAEVLALSCTAPVILRPGDRTRVTVHVDPAVAQVVL